MKQIIVSKDNIENIKNLPRDLIGYKTKNNGKIVNTLDRKTISQEKFTSKNTIRNNLSDRTHTLNDRVNSLAYWTDLNFSA